MGTLPGSLSVVLEMADEAWEEVVEPRSVCMLLEAVTVEMPVLGVFIEVSVAAEEVVVTEDETPDVAAVENASDEVVPLINSELLLLLDKVPFTVPVVIGMTGPPGTVILGEAVLNPFDTVIDGDKIEEVEELEAGTDAVGPKDKEVLVTLPYGAPPVEALDEKPLDGPLLSEAEIVLVLLLVRI